MSCNIFPKIVSTPPRAPRANLMFDNSRIQSSKKDAIGLKRTSGAGGCRVVAPRKQPCDTIITGKMLH